MWNPKREFRENVNISDEYYLNWEKAKVSCSQKKYRGFDRKLSNNIFSQFPSHFVFKEYHIFLIL